MLLDQQNEADVAANADIVPCRSDNTSAAAPIDYVHLRRYTLGDRELEREVLHLFASQLPDILSNLRLAHESDDDKAWHMAAHTLKGSARAIGAGAVGDLAQSAEMVSDTGRTALVASIERASQDVLRHLATTA